MIKIHMLEILQLIGCKGSQFYEKKNKIILFGQTCVIIIEASVTVSNYPSAKLDH